MVRTEDKYGLIDPSGKRIADIPYRVLGEFHQGLLRVQKAGHPTAYGFVNRDGRVAIEPEGNLFVNGRLRVKDGFTWGYKDATGKWAIPAKYNDAENFKDGVARVQQGDKWITINPRGKEVPEDKRKVRPVEPPSEGLALAADKDLLGWIDDQGKPAFPFRKYDEAHKFSAGRARIKVDDMYGFLDRTGKLVIPAQYYGASDFDHGLAYVQTREGMAYIDPAGAVVWKSKSR